MFTDRNVYHQALTDFYLRLRDTPRRLSRYDVMPLGPIRSLHYFLPVIEELLAQPVPESYVANLRSKLTLRPAADYIPAATG